MLFFRLQRLKADTEQLSELDVPAKKLNVYWKTGTTMSTDVTGKIAQLRDAGVDVQTLGAPFSDADLNYVDAVFVSASSNARCVF